MSTLTLVPSKSASAKSAKSSGLVQTFFDWDAPATRSPVATPNAARATVAAKSAATYSTTARRGREEHVGVALVSVLGKYGISVDDLLHEIERQKREQLAVA